MKKIIIAAIIAINLINITSAITVAFTEKVNTYSYENMDTDYLFVVEGGHVVYTGSAKVYNDYMNDMYHNEMY